MESPVHAPQVKALQRPDTLPAQSEALQTLRDLIRYTCTRLELAGCAYGHGTDNARDEAVWLVLWSLRLPLDTVDLWLDARVTDAERDFVLELIHRRTLTRAPLAYLCGEAWLRGSKFRADFRALVPRSPIADLLIGDNGIPDPSPILNIMPETMAIDRVLDLCTGGGSLAILAALAFPDASVDAADLNADALSLAQENILDYGLMARVFPKLGDLFAACDEQTYDLIVCNPPYVNAQSMAALPPEYHFEPQGALGGGDDGMDLVRRILRAAPDHLNEGGVIILEIGNEKPFFEAAFPTLDVTWMFAGQRDDMVVAVSHAALLDAIEGGTL